ncbi:MAG TPA: ComEC/Rec2 family competence protein [Acidobacteriaceae bacterium]|nr:ComEC/Rec2 family competence protein [Acidobacteriaceae bacterium]
MVTATTPASSACTQQPVTPLASHLPATLAAPSLFAALCFAAGILLAYFRWFLPGLFLLALLAAFAVATVAATKAPRLAWITTALVYLLLGVFCAEVAPAVNLQQKLALLANNTRRTVEGEIIRLGAVRTVVSPLPFSDATRTEHSQRFDLRIPKTGTARITVYAPITEPLPQLACNDIIRADTSLHQEELFLDPGVWDAREYLLEQGIGALGSVNSDRLNIVSAGHRSTFSCWLHSLQQSASARLIDFASDPHNLRLPAFLRIDHEDATMLTAMITGDRTWLEHRTRIGFERTGSFHLLVVSGLHLAIFSGLIFWITRRLRLSRVWSSFITIALSLVYALFTGFGHPVQRSFWMVALYLIGRVLWRDRSSLNAIGFAALVMLAARPRSLFDSGLQMTLLSVLAIAGIVIPFAEKTFAPPLRALHNLREIRIDTAFPPRLAQFRVTLRLIAQHLRPLTGAFLAWKAFPFTLRLLLRIAELLAVSVTIEMFMMLPMAAYFHRITLFALPVNVLIVPFLGILLPCALLTFATLLIMPALGFIPGAATAVILHSVTRVVTVFSALRLANMRLPMPSSLVIALWIALIALAICVIRLRRYGIPLSFAAIIAAAVILVLPRPITRRPGQLEISVIDVGQGDSILVVTPTGKTLLIDAGGLVDSSPNSNFNIGEDVVSPVLWSRGIRRLDAVALTHGHKDHIGGMPAIFANFRPRQLWLGPEPDVPVVENLLHDAGQDGTYIHHYIAGDTFTFGGLSIRVLSPAPGYHPRSYPTNDDSLVLHLTYGHTSALIEGDAERPSENRMLAEGHLHADFLKVGHHGSSTSTTPGFLAAVDPAYSAVSVGLRNFYGLPRPQVLHRLQSAHVHTYLTDTVGMSNFFLDGKHVYAAAWTASQH